MCTILLIISLNTRRICIQDTLSSRAALGLPAVQPLGRVRRASKGILHTIEGYDSKYPYLIPIV